MMGKFLKLSKWLWYVLRYNKFLQSLPLSTVIGHGVVFVGEGSGKNVLFGERVTVCPRVPFETGLSGSISIGDNVWISKDVMISASESVTIGSNSMIGEFSSIRDADHGCDSIESPMRFQGMFVESVCIEDDVWIGRGVAVLKGVTIGKGSIVGANAVVTRDIPEYSIAVGIPARVVKSRKS